MLTDYPNLAFLVPGLDPSAFDDDQLHALPLPQLVAETWRRSWRPGTAADVLAEIERAISTGDPEVEHEIAARRRLELDGVTPAEVLAMFRVLAVGAAEADER